MNSVIDFRTIEHRFRHAIFFSIFEGLNEGATFEFINDHDPAPLHRQLVSMGINNLEWMYVEKGPSQWRILITKKPLQEAAHEGCCGICSGSGHKG